MKSYEVYNVVMGKESVTIGKKYLPSETDMWKAVEKTTPQLKKELMKLEGKLKENESFVTSMNEKATILEKVWNIYDTSTYCAYGAVHLYDTKFHFRMFLNKLVTYRFRYMKASKGWKGKKFPPGYGIEKIYLIKKTLKQNGKIEYSKVKLADRNFLQRFFDFMF